MASGNEQTDSDIQKLMTSMRAARDPSKRVIKPTNNDISLFDELDDDSDSEYVAGEEDDSDDSNRSASNSSDSDDESASHSGSTNKENSSCNSPNSIPDKNELEVIETKSPVKQPTLPAVPTPSHPITSKLKSRVCLLCLQDHSLPTDELIECDRCGVIVHEDCHKVANGIFINDTNSSSSTDPWFCEPCLAGVGCELCPNQGGVFKRTDNNCWVHLLCALYIPGIAYNEPDTLMDVTLSELPSKNWSAHECSLCDVKFFAWTGICICCDAGMCKNYFHVTCAQKNGLLAEPMYEENPSDPFFAQCSQHTDKLLIKQRKRNYLNAISHVKAEPNSKSEIMSDDHLDVRTRRKLNACRAKYQELVQSRGKPFIPGQKKMLFLENSSNTLKLFMKKAHNLGLPTKMTGKDSQTEGTVVSHHPAYPAFTGDFVTYFTERERRISQIQERIKELRKQMEDLQVKESSCSSTFSQISVKVAASKSTIDANRRLFSLMLQAVKSLNPDLSPSAPLKSILHRMDNEEEEKKPLQNGSSNSHTVLSTTNRRRFSRVPVPIHVSEESSSNDSAFDAISKNQPRLSATTTSSLQLSIDLKKCSVCNKVEDQHLIAVCDTCKKSYHINCLSPPLSRVPKRSSRWLWQCCFCTKLELEKEVEKKEVDLDEPRRLRKSASSVRPLNSIMEQDDEEIKPKRVRREVKRPNFISIEFCIDSPPKRKPKSKKVIKQPESSSSRSSTVAQVDSTSTPEQKKDVQCKVSPVPTETVETTSVDSQLRNSLI